MNGNVHEAHRKENCFIARMVKNAATNKDDESDNDKDDDAAELESWCSDELKSWFCCWNMTGCTWTNCPSMIRRRCNASSQVPGPYVKAEQCCSKTGFVILGKWSRIKIDADSPHCSRTCRRLHITSSWRALFHERGKKIAIKHHSYNPINMKKRKAQKSILSIYRIS